MLDQRRRRWADVVQVVYNCLCLLGRYKIIYVLGINSGLNGIEK